MFDVPVLYVGAGPGDPELITVKGLKALQQAEVLAAELGLSRRTVWKHRLCLKSCDRRSRFMTAHR